MSIARMKLGELLVSNRLLTPQQLTRALEIQCQHFQPLGQILVKEGFITEDRLLQACAAQKGVAAWFLHRDPPTKEALALVPAALCRSHQLLPVKIVGDRIILAMRDPSDIDALDMVRNACRMRVEPVLVNDDRLQKAIEVYHRPATENVVETEDTMKRLVTEALGEFNVDDSAEQAQLTEAELRPVVGLVNQVLLEAIKSGVSDIHFEPRKDRVEIRYRIDGQLKRVYNIPAKLQAALIARIKIIGAMDIVEYRMPQDGRIAVTTEGRTIDFRVSVLPGYHGQRVVMRVLDKSMTLRNLADLGLSERNRALLDNMVHQPYGLSLVTGPTGSGKTTTLYAAINLLKDQTNNIMTCEDPVEYDIDGINQSQINEKVGLTFAAQLRAILRQDPDIILVGEIRDQETAETAIRAALTGHLVLSTLHSNDAPSAIPRLLDMGIEPFLLSTSLNGVMSQRLVRILCPECKEQYDPSSEERDILEPMFNKPIGSLWRPRGCSSCSNAGFKGRMGIHEILPTPHAIQRAIAAEEPLDTIRALAFDFNYRPMQYDAAERVISGATSLAEVRRLVAFETSNPGRTRSWTPTEEAPELTLKAA
jgi:type IV pilus assembly protein PilB